MPLALAACLMPPSAAAEPPNASFSVAPEAPHTIETVTFTSTSTGDITSQSWDLDNQGGCDDATGPTAERSFPVAGTYRISLCVVGPDGEAAQARNVVIANQPPAASLVHLPAAPEAGDSVTFVSTSKDPDGAIASHAWDLDGDGEFDDGGDVSASRTFSRPGAYEVALLVTDSNGEEVTATQAITVRSRLMAPFPTVGMRGLVIGDGARISLFRVDAPPGAQVKIRCRGPGCPPARAVPARMRRYRRFERELAAGAVIEVFVTKPGTIGKYTRFTIRSGQPPQRTDLCLFPGRKRPKMCPVV